ncbi:hypothetical protein EJ05DRAFT_317648 [Pseudovirgaria hyperparasitica]|uniref:Secreted protein n=1 Tax=Pseudovirgaria hyperparasitica TaxID=470096 RepID=A0A6A6WEG4_9PEZI|nr:uncharacterized protein EJ05DRAFT_317648 [Pseudovirgaria hyperparasitica]KAF2759977.1 hypothetical protein EJ05DRAFT_317648 [Pseudovirgaria hyperparasitica]
MLRMAVQPAIHPSLALTLLVLNDFSLIFVASPTSPTGYHPGTWYFFEQLETYCLVAWCVRHHLATRLLTSRTQRKIQRILNTRSSPWRPCLTEVRSGIEHKQHKPRQRPVSHQEEMSSFLVPTLVILWLRAVYRDRSSLELVSDYCNQTNT